jgi:hypothetical protein
MLAPPTDQHQRTQRAWTPVLQRWSLMDEYLIAVLVAGSAALGVVVWVLAKSATH